MSHTFPAMIENNANQAVNGRDLHTFLESKQEFANWMKDRIKRYGFVKNEDFHGLIKLSKRQVEEV